MNTRRLLCNGMMGAALVACSGLSSTPPGTAPFVGKRPTKKKLQGVSSHYDSRFYDMASR